MNGSNCMKTKLFSLWLLLSVAVGLSAYDYDFEVDGLCYNITSSAAPYYTVEVTYYERQYTIDYRIPAYPGLTIANIPESVTYGNQTYRVTSIGFYAFRECSNLTSITIPNSVTSIGERAFYGCTGLTSVTIPNSVTSIGERAFEGCTSLISVAIGNSVTSMGENVFYNTPWYNNKPDGVVYINNVLYCYKGKMPGNTSIVVENGTIGIASAAFRDCTGLTSITIPNSVTSIGERAFEGCTGLTSITIPNNVTSIEWSAFSGCTGLTSITIPNSVTSIEGWAFYSCTGLTSITIPNSVTSIEGWAFYSCTGLTSITIGNSVTSMGGNVFDNTPWYNNKPNGVVYINNVLYCYKGKMPDNTSIVVENGTIGIASAAFLDCTGLTSITIPNSVTSIGERAFYGCTGLTSITIPNSVTWIGESAFEYSQMHKFVCMNPDVEFSGEMPRFSYALDTIIAPARVFDVEESEWLTQPKFLKHAELTNGEMTDNVCRVLNRSYKTLLTLDLKGVSNTTIADEAFKGCYNLKTLRLPAQLTKVPYMAVADCKSLQEITIPATVEEIDNSAFENCRSIRSITFEGAGAPQGAAQYAPTTGCALWRIGNWAFYNCHELQNLLIPEGVTEIGDAAFYGCVYLQDMVLPSTIETIGDNAFALCGKLQKITVLSTTPPTIEAKTFYDVNRAIPVYVPAEAVADYKNDRYWKEFNIQSNATAIEQTSASNITPRKIFRDGQVYILRGGKTYTLTGVEVNL
mgnify:FL=1